MLLQPSARKRSQTEREALAGSRTQHVFCQAPSQHTSPGTQAATLRAPGVREQPLSAAGRGAADAGGGKRPDWGHRLNQWQTEDKSSEMSGFQPRALPGCSGDAVVGYLTPGPPGSSKQIAADSATSAALPRATQPIAANEAEERP